MKSEFCFNQIYIDSKAAYSQFIYWKLIKWWHTADYIKSTPDWFKTLFFQIHWHCLPQTLKYHQIHKTCLSQVRFYSLNISFDFIRMNWNRWSLLGFSVHSIIELTAVIGWLNLHILNPLIFFSFFLIYQFFTRICLCWCKHLSFKNICVDLS